MSGCDPAGTSRTDLFPKTSEDLQAFRGLGVAVLRGPLVPTARLRRIAVEAPRAKLGEHLAIEGAGELECRIAVASSAR